MIARDFSVHSDVAVASGRKDRPGTRSSSAWREIWPPLALFAIYLLLLHHYWAGVAHLPFQDTLYIYETFAIAYNQLFQTGELAQWLPYSNYGIPTYLHDITNFPPFYIVTFALGAALKVRNIWALFDCAVAIDVAIFTFGTYLLLRQFSSRTAAAVITAGALWTLVLEWNLYFTLRLVALMPLALFFLVRWARSGSLVTLSLSVVIAVISCLGVAQYFAPYYALFYVCCTVALWIADRPLLRVSRSIPFIGIGIFAVVSAAAVTYLYMASIRGLHFLSYGRDPVTGKVDLDIFLNYGGLQVFKVLEALVALPTESKTPLFYAGGVTLVLAFYALWRARSSEMWAFAALTAVFTLFCAGPYSPVARLAFYFPGMSYFRHVGVMYAVPKLLLGVVAAIGLDAALNQLDKARDTVLRLSYVIGALAIAVAAAYYPLADFFERPIVGGAGLSSILLLFAAVGGIALIGPIFRHANHATISVLLLLTTLVQGAAYQHLFRDNLNSSWQPPSELTRVHAIKFVERRDDDEIRTTSPYREIEQQGVVYAQLDTFLQIDECASTGHFEYDTLWVHRLLEKVFGGDTAYDDLQAQFSEHHVKPAVAHILGCGVSKIQWVPAAVGEDAANGKEPLIGCVNQALCLESSTGAQKVLQWPRGEPPAAPSLSSQGINLDHFSLNDLVISLTVISSGWLVYADSFFPGWHAEVDGQSVPIWRANFAFKAVELAPGHHVVRFYFSDPTYNWVFWGSGVVWTAAILLLFVVGFSRKGLALI